MANLPIPVPQLQARLSYLNDSAHLLASASNSSSSYIMSQANDLMFVHEVEQPTSHRRNVCNSCGNIMILGRTAEFSLESVNVRKGHFKIPRSKPGTSKSGKAAASSAPKPKAVVYKCLPCGRDTVHKIDAPAPSVIRNVGSKVAKSTAMPNGVPIPSTSSAQDSLKNEATVSSANASAKQRKKARKQGGLLALLAKNREAKKEGFGLDLMDLMKKV